MPKNKLRRGDILYRVVEFAVPTIRTYKVIRIKVKNERFILEAQDCKLSDKCQIMVERRGDDSSFEYIGSLNNDGYDPEFPGSENHYDDFYDHTSYHNGCGGGFYHQDKLIAAKLFVEKQTRQLKDGIDHLARRIKEHEDWLESLLKLLSSTQDNKIIWRRK